MAIRASADQPHSRAPWFGDEITASREKLLRVIGEPPDLTFIRGYGNIGDRLIYAGTRQLLSGFRCREVNILQLDGVVGHTALVSGGGAWCQPYHEMPQYLQRIEAQFRRVIILPSSFDVSDDCVRVALAQTKALVFARERESYKQISELCHADLAHDCAFFFDYEPYRQSGEGSLYAYRADREASGQPLPADNCDISATCETLDEWLWTIARHAEIYTDRAHVMIAAAMLGKRVRYRASSYHKVPAIAEYALANFPVRCSPAPERADEDESSVREALLDMAREHLQLLPVDFVARHRNPLVTVVMLSWHRLEQTLRAVQALRDHVVIPFRLLLVDNNSDADTQDALRALSTEHDFIELHLLRENLGCAGGRNHALSYVKTEYLVFLDNDLEVFPGTIEHLLWQMEEHQDAVGVTGRMILPNGRVHLCGADYHTADGVLHYELLGFAQHFTEPPGVSGACGWVPGCLSLLRTSTMLEHRYDPGMRNYYEDLEWCYRLNKQNAGIFYRCIEALGLHHHELKGAARAPDAGAAHQEAMRFIETIAHFYAVHGQIIPNLFSFVPELGPPADPRSVAAARLLLTLVQSRGSEWALNEWNEGRLQPLFGVSQFAQLTEQLISQQSINEQTRSECEQAGTEAARLFGELQALHVQAEQETREREALQSQLQQQVQTRVGLETQLQLQTKANVELQSELEQHGRAREELQSQLQQQAQARVDLETQLQLQTKTREDLESQLEQHARAGEELQVQLQQQSHENDELQERFQQQSLVREGLEAELTQRTLAIKELETQLREQTRAREEIERELQQQVRAREEVDTELQNRVSELVEIRRSRYWRALESYWRMRDRVRRRRK